MITLAIRAIREWISWKGRQHWERELTRRRREERHG